MAYLEEGGGRAGDRTPSASLPPTTVKLSFSCLVEVLFHPSLS